MKVTSKAHEYQKGEVPKSTKNAKHWYKKNAKLKEFLEQLGTTNHWQNIPCSAMHKIGGGLCKMEAHHPWSLSHILAFASHEFCKNSQVPTTLAHPHSLYK